MQRARSLWRRGGVEVTESRKRERWPYPILHARFGYRGTSALWEQGCAVIAVAGNARRTFASAAFPG